MKEKKVIKIHDEIPFLSRALSLSQLESTCESMAELVKLESDIKSLF